MATEYFSLDVAGWINIQSILNVDQRSPNITPTIVRHLQNLGAAFVIVEREYLDRDFSEAYSFFYSRLFRRHSKTCTRLLFFSADLSKILRIRNVEKRSNSLQSKGNSSFLGYVVLRPIHQAPVAQVVLRVPPAPNGLETRLQVKSRISVHALGAEFTLDGIPMTQQDQRIGACAQAAIWTCARHFYYKHRGPWVSMVGVNEAAMSRAQWNVSFTIPNGSEFLTFNEMVHALQGIGRKSLVYMADTLNPISWNNLRAEDIISRYVDSGIPVIIGMPSPSIGHAVVATGQVRASAPIIHPLPPKPTRAIFTETFLVNDDQLGPNLRMGVNPSSSIGETPYNITNAGFLLIGLPDKVYLPAEKAEELSWDIMTEYIGVWPRLVAAQAGILGNSVSVGNTLGVEFTANRVIARTYLTYGWKYKYRAVRNIMSEEVKQIALDTDLPRYVWVTEFGTVNSLAHSDFDNMRIFSHCVIDATGKSMQADSRLLFHAPGTVVRLAMDSKSNSNAPKYKREQFWIKDDVEYRPKRRGETYPQ